MGVLRLLAAAADQAPVHIHRLVLDRAQESFGKGFEVAPGQAIVVRALQPRLPESDGRDIDSAFLHTVSRAYLVPEQQGFARLRNAEEHGIVQAPALPFRLSHGFRCTPDLRAFELAAQAHLRIRLVLRGPAIEGAEQIAVPGEAERRRMTLREIRIRIDELLLQHVLRQVEIDGEMMPAAAHAPDTPAILHAQAPGQATAFHLGSGRRRRPDFGPHAFRQVKHPFGVHQILRKTAPDGPPGRLRGTVQRIQFLDAEVGFEPDLRFLSGQGRDAGQIPLTPKNDILRGDASVRHHLGMLVADEIGPGIPAVLGEDRKQVRFHLRTDPGPEMLTAHRSDHIRDDGGPQRIRNQSESQGQDVVIQAVAAIKSAVREEDMRLLHQRGAGPNAEIAGIEGRPQTVRGSVPEGQGVPNQGIVPLRRRLGEGKRRGQDQEQRDQDSLHLYHPFTQRYRQYSEIGKQRAFPPSGI